MSLRTVARRLQRKSARQHACPGMTDSGSRLQTLEACASMQTLSVNALMQSLELVFMHLRGTWHPLPPVPEYKVFSSRVGENNKICLYDCLCRSDDLEGKHRVPTKICIYDCLHDLAIPQEVPIEQERVIFLGHGSPEEGDRRQFLDMDLGTQQTFEGVVMQNPFESAFSFLQGLQQKLHDLKAALAQEKENRVNDVNALKANLEELKAAQQFPEGEDTNQTVFEHGGAFWDACGYLTDADMEAYKPVSLTLFRHFLWPDIPDERDILPSFAASSMDRRDP